MKRKPEAGLQQSSLLTFFVPAARPCEHDENHAEATTAGRPTPSKQQSPGLCAADRRQQVLGSSQAQMGMSAAEHQAIHEQQQQQQQQQQKICHPVESAAAAKRNGLLRRAAAFDSTAAAGAGPGACGLTEYELQRLQRIRRNQEVMHGLGLSSTVPEPRKSAAAASPKRRRPCRQAAAVGPEPAAGAAPPETRSRGAAAAGTGSAAGLAAQCMSPGAEAQAAAEAGLKFDDSSVRRYVCQALTAAPPNFTCGARSSAGLQAESDERVAGLAQLPGCLRDPALARAYSVDWRPGLLVAGGKDGVVSVFGSRELEGRQLAQDATLPPLLSHKLHRGWVSDVQLTCLNPSSTSSTSTAAGSDPQLLLLTAGNDGAVRLWDLGQAAQAGSGTGIPQQLAQAQDLHTGGIFSLHEQAGRVLSASKDGTVAISSLGGSCGTASLAATERYDTLHDGVIKCARWQRSTSGAAPATTFASCGNDRRLCIVDSRQSPASGASLVIEGSHSTALNCLRWHPTAQHLLLTCSHDPAILLHDLRSPAQPLQHLRGHAQGPRISAMYQPAFVGGGAAIATGCERSRQLTLYCTATGATLSRGDAGVTAGATCCGGQPGDPLICTAGRAVYFFQPL